MLLNPFTRQQASTDNKSIKAVSRNPFTVFGSVVAVSVQEKHPLGNLYATERLSTYTFMAEALTP